MKLRLNEKQYKLISEFVKKEIEEQGAGDVNSEPSAGTSQTQSGGQGYPQVGKWQSGVTRGPGNQIGVTKWSDVVGSTLKRSKANQLKENELKKYFKYLLEQNENSEYDTYSVPTPNAFNEDNLYLPKNSTVFYFTGEEDLMKIYDQYRGTEKEYLIPKSKDELPKITPNTVKGFITPSDNKTYFMTIKHQTDGKKVWYWYNNADNVWYVHTNYIQTEIPQELKTSPYLKIWQIPQNFKDLDRPSEPVPAKEVFPNYVEMRYNKMTGKSYNYKPYEEKKRVPGTTVETDEYYYWVYRSPLTQKLSPSDLLSSQGELTLIGTKEQVWKRFEEESNNWLIANRNTTYKEEQAYFKHQTPEGEDVPYGIDPKRYPEYKQKLTILNQKLKDLQNKANVIIQQRADELGYQPNMNTEYDDEIENVKKQIESLTNEYRSEDFSYGIREEEKALFYERLEEIVKEYDVKIKEVWESIKQEEERIRNLSSQMNPSDRLGPSGSIETKRRRDINNQRLSALYEQRKNEVEFLKFMFGKDDWTKNLGMFGEKFDRWWDKYGTVAQIVGNIAIVVVSGGIAAVVEGAAVGAARVVGLKLLRDGTVRAIAPYAADGIFNAAVGGYQLSRGQNMNALISLMCTIVPFISYGKNIGKISVAEAEELVKQINKVDFTNTASVQQFVSTLSDRQRYIFRNASTLSKEAIKQGYDEFLKKANMGVVAAGAKVTASSVSQWLPPLLKTLSLEGGVPFIGGVITGLIEFLNGNTKQEITQAELTEIKEYIKQQLENLTVPEVVAVVLEITKDNKNGESVKNLKAATMSAVLHYGGKMTKEQKIKNARSIGKPDDYFINPKKYEKKSNFDVPVKEFDPFAAFKEENK